jgi:hypothetical protein
MDFKLNKDAQKLIDCATTYASKNDLNVSLSLISGILLKSKNGMHTSTLDYGQI